jgi:DNA-binding IclR family transcriptional regulator
MTLGTCSVAVPIREDEGQVVAALGLVTRTVRRDLAKFVPALNVAAAAITRGLREGADT